MNTVQTTCSPALWAVLGACKARPRNDVCGDKQRDHALEDVNFPYPRRTDVRQRPEVRIYAVDNNWGTHGEKLISSVGHAAKFTGEPRGEPLFNAAGRVVCHLPLTAHRAWQTLDKRRRSSVMEFVS